MSAAADHRPPRTAVQRAADALREEILSVPDGALLGSEDSLLRRLHVSRPTLRQTARLLEHEQLLSVRRGVKGGYYARTPDVGSVANVAAFHLRMRGTTLRKTFLASQPLLEEALRGAALSENGAAREAFADLADGLSRPGLDVHEGVMLGEESRLIQAILELAGNPAIELMVRILYEFGLRQTGERIFADRPDRIQEWMVARDRLVAAIRDRDAEMAVLLGRRRRDVLSAWLDADLGSSAADVEISDARAGVGAKARLADARVDGEGGTEAGPRG